MTIKNKNIKAFIQWRIYMLLTNLIVWNVMLRLFIFLNLLVNPDLFINGPKIFQIIYEHPVSTITGMASAIAFGSWIIEDLLLYKFLFRKSMGIVFLLRAAFTFLSFIVFAIVLGIFHYRSVHVINFYEYLGVLKQFIQNNAALYLFAIGVIISVFLNFIKAITQKVGHEKFFKIISGYYRIPREEDRIFVFIDLISSTHYAELLGHKRYSYFLMECFRGIGILQVKYRGTQYQFVGDEVVISWSAKKKQNFKNAVNFFFEFKQRLQLRQEYFQKEFGIVPNFTASINSGKIMMAEVGDVKSEIAYHGDILNTAARIQKQCKSFDKEILVTENFVNNFKEISNDYTYEWIAKKKLSGKQAPVTIYSIQNKKDTI